MIKKAKNNKKTSLVFRIATIIQIILWTSSFEAVTYATAYSNWLTKYIFLILTAGIVFLHIIYIAIAEKKHIFILKIAWMIVLINIFFGFLTRYIPDNGNKFKDYEISSIIDRYKKDNTVSSEYKILFKDDNKNFIIVGKKRSLILKKYLGVTANKSNDSDHKIFEIIPDDFFNYLKLCNFNNYYETNFEHFEPLIYLQYPDYIYLIIYKKYNTDLKKYDHFYLSSFEDFTHFKKLRIRHVHPVIEELLFGGICERLNSYWSIIRYTFKSPHYRTDMVDDPYFLIWRGEIDKAKEKLKTLPPERKAFIENKLRNMGEIK